MGKINEGTDPVRGLMARMEMLEASGIRFLLLPCTGQTDPASGVQAGHSGHPADSTPAASAVSCTGAVPAAANPGATVEGDGRPDLCSAAVGGKPPAASPCDTASYPGAARAEAPSVAAAGVEAGTIRVRREDSLFEAAGAAYDSPRGSKSEMLDAIRERAMACALCPLHKTRTHVVFGDGNPEAELVFVGEAPGADEDVQGLPFVGRAGQLLNKMIAAMGLKREEVYICNVLKCRPPNNRTPAPDEVRLCSPYLEEQLETIRPLVICALGSPAAQTLLRTKLGIGAIRGRFHEYRGIATMATYHPAYVLRSYTEEVRRTVWEDLKKVRAKLDELRAARRAGK